MPCACRIHVTTRHFNLRATTICPAPEVATRSGPSTHASARRGAERLLALSFLGGSGSDRSLDDLQFPRLLNGQPLNHEINVRDRLLSEIALDRLRALPSEEV